MFSHNDWFAISFISPHRVSGVHYEQSRSVFWPFFLWRVLAPSDVPELNLFQTLLLKLIRSGCQVLDSLVSYSNLDKELVLHIIAELENKGLLDGWQVTEQGIEVLGGIQQQSTHYDSYYLIQDAQSGQLLPRLFSKISHIDTIDLSQEFPSFVKSRSSGKRVTPLLIKTNGRQPEPPKPQQMADAVKQHRLERNQLKQGGVELADDSLKSGTVQLIEAEPIPVYVHLQIFSSIGGEQPWYISDPAGLTQALPLLRDSVIQCAKNNKSLNGYIDSVMGIAEVQGDKGDSSYQAQQKVFDERANLALWENYGWTDKYSLIHDQVLSMLRLKIRVNEAGEAPRPELLNSLLSESQNVVEAWAKTLVKPDPANTDWHVLVKDWGGNGYPVYNNSKLLLKAMFQQLGCNSEYAATQLATVRGGNIRSALTHGNQSLKAMLAAVLLAFPLVVEQINQVYADWLDDIICLANDRNRKASHASLDKLNKTEALNHCATVETLLTVLATILGETHE